MFIETVRYLKINSFFSALRAKEKWRLRVGRGTQAVHATLSEGISCESHQVPEASKNNKRWRLMSNMSPEKMF
jgi:hypothetical protein